MEDYPRTLLEFERQFASEEACRQYLLRLKWPDGFTCPRCADKRGWLSKRGLITCAACGFQASITAGTIFQNTHKPLGLWFRGIWLVTSQKTGASALGGPTGSGIGQLRDSVDMVAQIASGDGSAGTRQTEWTCRGRRFLLGCLGRRDSWPTHRFQDGDCSCGRGKR